MTDEVLRVSVVKKQSLQEIVSETQKVIDLIISHGGEMSAEVEMLYDNLSTSLAHKVDMYAFIDKKLESEAEFFKTQANYYQQISKSFSNSRERLRDRIKCVLLTLQQIEIRGETSRFALSQAAKKLVIDETKLSNTYKTVIQTLVPDREKILKDLKDGIKIDGAELLENFALRQYVNRKG